MAQSYAIQEQLQDPRARAEAYDQVQGLKEGHLLEVIREQKNEAEEDTKEWRRQSSDWWDLWENRIDFTAKDDWQSQIWIAKPFAAVEQATALIQRSMVDSPDFWGVSGEDERDKTLADNLWKPLLERILTESHFREKYVATTRSGFVTGCAGYLKARLQVSMVQTLAGVQPNPTGAMVPQFTKRPKSFLTLDWVSPDRIYRDPETQPQENFSGSYLYHAEWKSRTFLQGMIRAGWREDAITEVLKGGRGQGGRSGSTITDSDRQLKDKKVGRSNKFRDTYLVNEGWCDILNEDGDLVFPDALMIEVGGRIAYLNENPLWATDLGTGRRKWPFIGGAPIPHPTRFIGRGIVEQDAPLSWLFSNAFNLITDGMNWLVNGEAEVYKDALEDMDDMSRYPGKLWIKKMKEQAFTRAQSGGLDLNAALTFLQAIDQFRQNTNFVTDFAVGMPGTRSDITKGEVQIKTAQSLAVFDAMARNLEGIGKETLELLYNMGVQFLMTDVQDPSIARILGTRNAALMSQAPIQQRVEMVQGNFDFQFTGVSQALQKSDMMARLQQFAAMVGTPPYLQLMMQQPRVFLDILGAARDALGLGDRIDLQTELPQQMGGLPPGISPAVIQMLMQGGAGAAAGPASFGGPALGPGPGAPPESGYADPAAMAGLAG